MNLLVIRHAIAMEREEYQAQARQLAREAGHAAKANDDFRPLTDEGIKKMRKNADGLDELAGRPDLLVTSPLVRAMQTAEILRETWSDVELATCDDLRPGADPSDFARWLKGRPQAEKPDCLVAIVGHEPHLSTMISWFMTGSDRSLLELKKGGACLLEFSSGFDRSKGRMAWLATPAMLRACR